MEPLTLLIIAIVALVAAGLGWFFASRPLAELRDRLAAAEGQAQTRAEALARMTPELATMSERALRADALALSLDAIRTERDDLRTDLAALREKVANFDEQKRLLAEAREGLLKEFQNAGNAVLGKAQEAFLARANEQFRQSEEKGAQNLKALLHPVGEKLASYEAQVKALEEKRVDAFGQLAGVIGEVRAGQERVLEGANRITTTLRGATKARGDWGELQFENLLESCGLWDQTDFDCQFSVPGGEGLLRPDGVIRIPGGRKLIVDVKNVFNTYAAANESDSEEERTELLRAHAREIRGHIDELSAKRYQDYVEGSADFVVMFVPGEHVLYAALTQDRGLLEYAMAKQVVLSSPLNFMSIALTVATIWRQAGMQADAKEIAALGKELYDRLARMGGLLAKVGSDLAKTNRSYNEAVGSFDTRLVPTGRKFQQLSIDTNAIELQALAPLEIEPRQLLHVEPDKSVD